MKRTQARWEALPSFGTLRLALVAIIAFILVALVYLAQASNAALIARELRVKQMKIQEVERENAQLRYEIAALASPSAIEQRARKLGLGPAKKVVYAEMPWIQPPPNELMPAFLPDGNFQAVPQTFETDSSTVLEQLLSVLGLGNLNAYVNAQTK
ncbi:MAG: Cell division protein FtsL [Anaerolineae bacterium]|nr:Cell division protein FtsL [Anaerolineae bacterium]